MSRYLVREIRYAPGCWPVRVVVAEPTMVCPLCVLTGRPAAKTAIMQHYITCQHSECGKMSAVFAPDGLLSLCPTVGPTLLSAVSDAQAKVMAALKGQGPLMLSDLVVIDETCPIVTVTFNIPRIRLPLPKSGDAQPEAGLEAREDLVLPGGVPNSILKLLRTARSRRAGA